jgi:hypothetical protein
MTLIIQKPTGAKLNLAPTYVGIDDPDAAVYVAAVEAADEAASPGVGALETATKVAIHSFVKGCKNDGIWPAIKASCILAGARTLTGALVPLVGTAPTNVGGLFVSGDYNRKTGLVGNGSTKYLNSNRNNNADPQNSKHVAAYVVSIGSGGGRPFVATGTGTGRTFINDAVQVTVNRSTFSTATAVVAPCLAGASRNSSATYDLRRNDQTVSFTGVTSETPLSQNLLVYRRQNAGDAEYSDARLAFYSIGESLDLALLDARITTLINAFAAAIP